MKKHEMIIIAVAVLIVGYFWWKNNQSTTPANPTNAASTGFTGMSIGGL